MLDDGIAFRQYASSADDPIAPRSLGEIAEGVQKLITKYDFGYSRLQESVTECDKRQRDQIAAQVQWERTRKEHVRWTIVEAWLLDEDVGPPEPGWRFQSFRGTDVADIHVEGELSDIMAAWFPPELCWQSRPQADCPLPLSDRELEWDERETILAAIYDCQTKGERKIADGLNPEHYDKLTGINLPEGKYDGMVKQIPAKDLRHLERWLTQFEKDLQSLAMKHASGAQGGRDEPTPAGRTEEAAGVVKVTPAVDQTEPLDQSFKAVAPPVVLDADTTEGTKKAVGGPSEDAFKAYRLYVLTGLKQIPLAKELSNRLGKPVSQGQVSRMLTQVEKYLKAGNILPALPSLTEKPQSVDPQVIELGERQDGHAKHQRQQSDHKND